MTLIRFDQPQITLITPHNGNHKFIIPFHRRHVATPKTKKAATKK